MEKLGEEVIGDEAIRLLGEEARRLLGEEAIGLLGEEETAPPDIDTPPPIALPLPKDFIVALEVA